MAARSQRPLDAPTLSACQSSPTEQIAELGAHTQLKVQGRALKAGSAGTLARQQAAVNEDEAVVDVSRPSEATRGPTQLRSIGAFAMDSHGDAFHGLTGAIHQAQREGCWQERYASADTARVTLSGAAASSFAQLPLVPAVARPSPMASGPPTTSKGYPSIDTADWRWSGWDWATVTSSRASIEVTVERAHNKATPNPVCMLTHHDQVSSS